jgi:hypothetical protein
MDPPLTRPWRYDTDIGYWVCETKAKERSRRSSRERVGWRSRTTPEAEVLESELHQIEIGIDTHKRCAGGGGGAYDTRSEIVIDRGRNGEGTRAAGQWSEQQIARELCD